MHTPDLHGDTSNILIHHLVGQEKPCLCWYLVAGLSSDPHWWAHPAWNLVAMDVTSHPDYLMTLFDNGTWTDGHFQVTWWHHITRSSHPGYWLTSPLEWWPWQHNADVWCRQHSHPVGPAFHIKDGCIEESNLSTIQRWNFHLTSRTSLPAHLWGGMLRPSTKGNNITTEAACAPLPVHNLAAPVPGNFAAPLPELLEFLVLWIQMIHCPIQLFDATRWSRST